MPRFGALHHFVLFGLMLSSSVSYLSILPGFLYSFLKEKTNQIMNLESNSSNKCFSLRPWALCFSLLIFSITGVFTTFAVLGTIHIDHVWELVNADIEEEHHRNEVGNYLFSNRFSTNEAKLRASKQLTLVGSWILYICTWVGSINMSTSILLIYGVAMKSPMCMVPWILISSISYVSVLIAILAVHHFLFPGLFVSFGTFVSSITASTVFILFWHVITCYFSELIRYQNKLNSSVSYPTVTVKSNSGYVHTLSSPAKKQQQQQQQQSSNNNNSVNKKKLLV